MMINKSTRYIIIKVFMTQVSHGLTRHVKNNMRIENIFRVDDSPFI